MGYATEHEHLSFKRRAFHHGDKHLDDDDDSALEVI